MPMIDVYAVTGTFTDNSRSRLNIDVGALRADMSCVLQLEL